MKNVEFVVIELFVKLQIKIKNMLLLLEWKQVVLVRAQALTKTPRR